MRRPNVEVKLVNSGLELNKSVTSVEFLLLHKTAHTYRSLSVSESETRQNCQRFPMTTRRSALTTAHVWSSWLVQWFNRCNARTVYSFIGRKPQSSVTGYWSIRKKVVRRAWWLPALSRRPSRWRQSAVSDNSSSTLEDWMYFSYLEKHGTTSNRIYLYYRITNPASTSC